MIKVLEFLADFIISTGFFIMILTFGAIIPVLVDFMQPRETLELIVIVSCLMGSSIAAHKNFIL
jgi:hypothetical protein